MDLVRGVDWLMMDDIGDTSRKDPETDDKRKLLYQIVNHRHNHVRPMLITSNLTPGEFTAQFGARTFERIAECCAVVKIGGRNLRRPGVSNGITAGVIEGAGVMYAWRGDLYIGLSVGTQPPATTNQQQPVRSK